MPVIVTTRSGLCEVGNCPTVRLRAKNRKALIICARSYKHWNNEFQNLGPIKNTDLKTQIKGNFIAMLFPRTTYFTSKHFGEDEVGTNNFKKLIKYL